MIDLRVAYDHFDRNIFFSMVDIFTKAPNLNLFSSRYILVQRQQSKTLSIVSKYILAVAKAVLNPPYSSTFIWISYCGVWNMKNY